MPTLEDVAKKAGVSTATVSKVLSNTPYFTEATRAKVMQAVEEIGYIPHLAARALSTGKTNIIAVVFPYVYDTIFTDPLVLRILEGIEAECTQAGYNILLSTPRLSTEGPDSHYQQLLQSRYIEGLIGLDHFPQASVIAPAQAHNIPAVAIGSYDTPCRVESDEFSGGLQLMEHLLGLGHRNIGIIGVPEALHYSIQKRIAGLRHAAEIANVNLDTFPRSDGDFSTSSGSYCASELLSRYPNLTALVCLNDRMALGAIQYARQSGRDVPHDLSVVGYDDIPMAVASSPPLTTIDQRAPELGHAAVRMLLQMFDKRQVEPQTLPVHLVVRQSTRQPRV